MAEQLSLFGEENTLFNGAVQRLLEMDFSGCLERLERYRKLFPWGREVRREAAVAAFWRERLGGAVWERIDSAEVERRYGLWLDFEKAFGCPWPEDNIEQQFQVRYFLRLTESLAASGEETPTSLPGGTPTGLLHLLAGRPSGAIPLLQGLIGAEPENARIYGYLGDAYVLRGDLPTARICYREAFSLDPAGLDLRRLGDRELLELVADQGQEDDLEPRALAWLPVRAHLLGIFPRRLFRGLDELRAWVERYLDLIRAHREHPTDAMVPRLFYCAMVLSDNAPMLRFVSSVDLAEVRRLMKSLNPALFARHMRDLETRR